MRVLDGEQVRALADRRLERAIRLEQTYGELMNELGVRFVRRTRFTLVADLAQAGGRPAGDPATR